MISCKEPIQKRINSRNDGPCKFTDAQAISTALIAAKKFKGYHASLDFLASYEWFCRLNKGVFSMRLYPLKPIIELIFQHLSHTIKSLNISKNYIIDTFPVYVCRNIIIKNCRLLKDENYRGFNNSKKE